MTAILEERTDGAKPKVDDNLANTGSPSFQEPPASPADETVQDTRQLAIVRITAGLWQLVLAVLTTTAAFAVWPRVSGEVSPALTAIRWVGHDFTFTPTSGVLLLGLIGGVAGSLVHTITIFSSRAGRRTLEATYFWWYLLRPFAAALLSLLFVAAVHSGLLSVTNGPKSAIAVVGFVAGGLAGLFTDAVLQKLRNLLGSPSTEMPASRQEMPLAGRPTPR